MLKTTILVASFLGAVAFAPPVPEHAVCDTFRDGASIEDIGKPVCWRATDTTAHAENGYLTKLGVCQKPNLPRNVDHLSIEAIQSRFVPIAKEPVCPKDMWLVYADVPLRDTPQCYCGVYRQPEIDSLAAIQQAYGEGGRMMCVKVELVDDVPTRSCYATHPDYPVFGDRDGGGLNYGGCRSDMHRCLHSNTLRVDDPRRGFLNTVERIQKEAEEEKAAHSLELLELNDKLEKHIAKADQLWAVHTVPNLWILDTDGTVKKGKYFEANDLTLHQCREKCADGNARGSDGAWPYCVGFSRQQGFVDPVPRNLEQGPDVPASCWWVTRYSHFEETDNVPGAGTFSNEYTFRLDAFDVDQDGSVGGDSKQEKGLTLAQCQAKCADGAEWVGTGDNDKPPWIGCAGFSRYSDESVAPGDSSKGECWWVKKYEDILDESSSSCGGPMGGGPMGGGPMGGGPPDRRSVMGGGPMGGGPMGGGPMGGGPMGGGPMGGGKGCGPKGRPDKEASKDKDKDKDKDKEKREPDVEWTFRIRPRPLPLRVEKAMTPP